MDSVTGEQGRRSMSRGTVALGALLLSLLAAGIYWRVHGFGFVDYDDDRYVELNPYVHAGFTDRSLHYAMTATFGGWSPLLWFSYLADRNFLGLNPGAMHVENVVLHSMTAILLWVLLARATGAWIRSYVVAALFVAHPMHVESVAWISERKDVLSTPLLLAAMIAYCRYCRLRELCRYAAYGLMLVCFILSLMTKAMGVSLPLLLLLLDCWPLGRMPTLNVRNSEFRMRLLEKIPLFAVATMFSAIAFAAQRASGAMTLTVRLSLFDRIDNAIVCDVLYLLKLIAPVGLAVFYPHPGTRPVGATVAAFGLLVFVTWITVRLRHRSPHLLLGWLWFLVTLLPVIGLVQIGQQAMADRYSYLPSVGIFVAIVWEADRLINRRSAVKAMAGIISAGLALAAISCFAMLARQQVSYWRDTSSLFSHSEDVTGPNTEVYLLAGRVAYEKGNLHAAIDDFNHMLQIDPGNSDAFDGLGNCWAVSDPARSITFYRKAIAIAPGLARYHLNLSAALLRAGDLTGSDGEVKEAMALDPEMPEAQAAFERIRSRSPNPKATHAQ